MDNKQDLIKQFNLFVQWHIDAVAQSRGYDSGAICVSYYVSSIATWQNDAKVFAPWRDQVWELTFVAIEPFEAGTGDLPDINVFIASLPPIVWPGA
jgi:hypothetical protein